jgi:hypothetical protein
MKIIQQVPEQAVEVGSTRDAQIKAALAALEREPVPAALVIAATHADWARTDAQHLAAVAQSA